MSIPMNRPCYPHVVGVFYPHPKLTGESLAKELLVPPEEVKLICPRDGSGQQNLASLVSRLSVRPGCGNGFPGRQGD